MIRFSKLLNSFAYSIVFSIPLFVIFEVLIYSLNNNGCLSYAYTFLLFQLINCFLDNDYRKKNIYSFHFFILLALIVYEIQLFQDPQQMGLTSFKYSGTDDAIYYCSVADKSYGIYYAHQNLLTHFFFIKFIRFAYPFAIIDPINIIIFNVLIGLCFLPYVTAKVSECLFDKIVAQKTYWLICFCPFTLSIGLVILRDVPGALLIMIIFLMYLRKNYVAAIAITFVLFSLKFGYVVYLLLPIFVHFTYSFGTSNGKKIILVLFFLLFLIAYNYYISPNLELLSQGRLSENNLSRDKFLDFMQETGEGSLLVKVAQMPFFFRVPLSIIAYLTMPMLNVVVKTANGIFLCRDLLEKLYPLYIMFYSRSFFDFILSKKKEKNAIILLVSLFLIAIALGYFSLQIRHKIVLMPFLYILIGYAITKVPRTSKSSLFQAIFILANIVYAIIKL